jgi:hypothetical protein
MKTKMISRIITIIILTGIVYYVFQNNKSEVTNVAYIQSVLGDVSKIHELTSETVKLKAGDKLVANEIIQTNTASSALIVFGNGYQFKLRIGENSSLKISDLMKSGIDKKEVTVLSLIRGQILALLNNQNNKAEIKIRTRHMAMGIRGTLLSVMSDGTNKSFLGVKHGEVSSINLITNKESIITNESVMFTAEDGKESVSLNKELINKINWEVDADSNLGSNQQEILSTDLQAANNQNDQNKLASLIASSEKHIEEHENELKRNISKIAELNEVIASRTQLANKDIECLSKYTERCTLLTEKELLHRGFPIEYGNKKYINLIIADLNKYKVEPQKEINELLAANEELNKTIEHKKKILSDAKSILSNSASTEEAKNEIEKKIREEI